VNFTCSIFASFKAFDQRKSVAAFYGSEAKMCKYQHAKHHLQDEDNFQNLKKKRYQDAYFRKLCRKY
jgi:Zn-dependent M16 (insulinase) family peptidase